MKLKKIKQTILTMLATVLFMLPCYAFDPAYDPKTGEGIKQEFPLAVFPRYSFPVVEVEGTAWVLVPDIKKGKWVKELTYWGQRGSGTVIKHGYILTAAHVVYPKRVTVHTSKGIAINTWPYKVESTQIFLRVDSTIIIPAWIDYIDQDADIAILAYIPNAVLEPINIEVAFEPSEMHAGDTVAIVTHQRENGQMTPDMRVIYGQIASPDVLTPFPEAMLSLSPNDFTIYIPVLQGDSGSAVFAFKNGKPFLIGWLHTRLIEYPLFYVWAGWLGDYERFFHAR